MATVWVRRHDDPEHAEIKIVVPRDGHISDVLTKAAGTLVFQGSTRVAGGLQASADGRMLSNKERIAPWEGRSLVISERGTAHPSPPRPSDYRNGAGLQHRLPQTALHTCAKCLQPILGLKVVLTLPGSPTSVDLHPECEVEYERAHALPCSYCSDLILDRLTTLTGDFGTINLHPQCVEPYKRMPPDRQPPPQQQRYAHPATPRSGPVQPAALPPPPPGGSPQRQFAAPPPHTGGGGGGYTCAHCKNYIEGTKVSLKLPGFNYKADLHPQCEYLYAVNHALRCDQCQQPMLDGITVLTGDFGNAKSRQLHPSCVALFKQAYSGHGANPPGPWNNNYTPSATQWRPVEGAVPGSYGGGVRWAPTNG